MKCPNCGASVSPGLNQCAYCESYLTPTHRSRLSRSEIFARIRASSAYQHASDNGRVEQLLQRDAKVHLAKGASWFSGGTIVFIVIAVFMMGPFCFFGLPLLPVVVTLWYFKNKSKFGSAMEQIQRVAANTMDGTPAIIVHRHSLAATPGHPKKCFVTLEFEDGQRRELAVHDTLYRRLMHDDAGVAFCQRESGILAEFERVRV